MPSIIYTESFELALQRLGKAHINSESTTSVIRQLRSKATSLHRHIQVVLRSERKSIQIDYLESIIDLCDDYDFNTYVDMEDIKSLSNHFNVTFEEILFDQSPSPEFGGDIFDTMLQANKSYDNQLKINLFRTLTLKHYKSSVLMKMRKYCEKHLLRVKSTVQLNYNPIFKGLEEEKYFNLLFYAMGYVENQKVIKKEGFNAFANAVRLDPFFIKNIFSFNLKMSTYIDYLNEAFSADIENKKNMSNPTKYIDVVKEWVTENKRFK